MLTRKLLSVAIYTTLCALNFPQSSAFISTDSSQMKSPLHMTTSSNEYDLNTVKAILFDIDGTLADSWKLGFDATQVVLESNGIGKITEEEYHNGCIYATPERLARHAGLSPSDPNFDEVGEKLGKEFDDHYVGLVSTHTAGFYDGIGDLLDSIPSNIKFGALTNACVGYAYAVLKCNSNDKSNIYDRFESIKGADNVPLPKPAPDGLLAVCADLSVKPEDCIYIGDSPTDGKAAEAAGMPSIGVLWGSHSEESLSKAPFKKLCQNVDDLKGLLGVVPVPK